MNRKHFLKNIGMAAVASQIVDVKTFASITETDEKSPKMPVVFIGHGSPMNAIQSNSFTNALIRFGQGLEKPKAVLVVSAHWLTRGTVVSTNPFPETIYDFGGFPEAMYTIKYPAPGSPEFARQVIETVKNATIFSDHTMGLDHGAWTVLKYIFPKADVPIFQLSIDATQGPAYHYELAKELQSLREKGVMILASGNVVHNLRMINFQNRDVKPYDWALEFDAFIVKSLQSGDHRSLVNYLTTGGEAARLSAPTNDHYLPLLYSVALQNKGDQLNYIHEGFEYGSISQRSFIIH